MKSILIADLILAIVSISNSKLKIFLIHNFVVFPSPSHDMATAMSSGAIKIIAYDQSTAENQQNDFNKYDKIYKELFSVCNQRN